MGLARYYLKQLQIRGEHRSLTVLNEGLAPRSVKSGQFVAASPCYYYQILISVVGDHSTAQKGRMLMFRL
jgi:hypothetical protein